VTLLYADRTFPPNGCTIFRYPPLAAVLLPASIFAQNILLTANPAPNNSNALAFTLTSLDSSKSNGEIPFEALKKQSIAAAVNY
jgi:hypothetical protein